MKKLAFNKFSAFFIKKLLLANIGPCVDKVSNCAAYGDPVCNNYRTWAIENCARFCLFCHGMGTCVSSNYSINSLIMLLLWSIGFCIHVMILTWKNNWYFCMFSHRCIDIYIKQIKSHLQSHWWQHQQLPWQQQQQQQQQNPQQHWVSHDLVHSQYVIYYIWPRNWYKITRRHRIK